MSKHAKKFLQHTYRARPTPQQSPAVCEQCGMAGSVPLPFIATFVPCPVFAISHRVGLITVPYTGLPIPLVTNLWHATCSSACVILVVYECLMCLIHLCVYAHMCMRPLGKASCLFVMWLLIRGHFIPWSPSESLLEAAISTQHSPQATWKAFYPARCSLF